MLKKLSITGIRGIPAAHGGFETFVEYLAPYLVENGWQITVYCQEKGDAEFYIDEWQGITRVHIPVKGTGSLSTVLFDIKSVFHVLKDKKQLNLTLGYNTAFLSIFYRLMGVKNLMNMDGIEWKRQKWSRPIKAFFYINEKLGCWFANHLIADHPAIKKHLCRNVKENKITIASYGAPAVHEADASLLVPYNLLPKEYAIMVGRIEPENSILSIIEAWSAKKRGKKLVVLGGFLKTNAYHLKVRQMASDEVVFLGAIYEQRVVQALRFYARLYIHGHTVGGTNPSLLESLGAANPVLAHNNAFNKWVTHNEQVYFKDTKDCAAKLDEILNDDALLNDMSAASRKHHTECFQWKDILPQHEALLARFL